MSNGLSVRKLTPSPTATQSKGIENPRGFVPMFGSFFNTAEVDKYADWVVGEVKRYLPLGFDLSTRNMAERAEHLNERIAKRTAEFTQKCRLNIYKKAHLAARVREGMSAHGYPESYVKSFSFDLLTRIQVASSQRTR